MYDEPRLTTIATNGIALEVATAGPESGPPVILLHGFPEPWQGWRHQIGPLAEAGYRVIAPNQRGYGRSEKPEGVASYGLDVLADDILGLIDATGQPRAAIVGHDWGGIVAWWLTVRHPDRVDRLAVLNAPHPVAFSRYIRTHVAQMLRNWYMFLFQIPELPEVMFRRKDWSALARSLIRSSRPGAFTDAELDRYRLAWSEPGAITAMIHWYRAARRFPPMPQVDTRVRPPTLLIWGVRDRFIGRTAADASLAHCDRGRLEWFEEATHWVQHEEPERVNRLLLDFLGDGRG